MERSVLPDLRYHLLVAVSNNFYNWTTGLRERLCSDDHARIPDLSCIWHQSSFRISQTAPCKTCHKL